MSARRRSAARASRLARRLVALALALLLAHGAHGATDDELFVELSASSRTPFVEQELLLRIRFGVEARQAQPLLVQPFQRTLEIPIQVQAPWLDAPPGLESLPALGSAADAPRCALNGAPAAAMARGEELRDGRSFRVWEIERRFAAPRAGRLRFAAVEALCVLGLQREQDLLGETQIIGRRELRARSAVLELEVVEPPAAERPAGYLGAVGSFELEASLDRSSLRYDEVLRLELRVRGPGNLERLTLPALDDLPSFHRLGVLDASRAGERIARYDFAPRASGKLALGPLEIPFLDPGPPHRYRFARSAVLDVEVTPDPAAAPQPSAAPIEPSETLAPWLPVLAGALLIAVLVGLAAARGSAGRRRSSARRSLGQQLAVRSATEGSAEANAVLDLLASWLGCTPSALHGSAVAERLEARGALPETASAIDAALARGISARYGARGPALPLARWIELLDALERECLSEGNAARAARREVN
ncbi:MAG: BatD family protein [Planctomycetes bacterium]|nr:BatD family protein [Planctomycetota bacterium]